GSFIVAISALVAVGGGSLTVPYLGGQNVDLKKAIGTSAAIGFHLSIAGTVGYIVNGWDEGFSSSSMSAGFVHLPAVVLISLVSFFTAPYGAKVAHKLPVAKLKKVFALLLMILSIKMLTSIL
ncbi:MAG: sulfite exporter TauE/SafE family protein, partial [Sulfurospirillaceae bacterium]|nr:sulfite exporter TauE/SafE family protein [Sulfurospirillaceae bacterium]